MGNGRFEAIAARRRFGMKPGLDTIRAICAALGNPQHGLRAIHVAGTNGKGAVCAILDAAIGNSCRYTSPHLVALNERFCIDGAPVGDDTLERAAAKVEEAATATGDEATFFEALTAAAFLVFAENRRRWTVLECGLGGRLDATNVCEPELCVITRIGLDHCQWLGDTVEKIAAEKAGIIKPRVPIVLGKNCKAVRAIVSARAKELDAPFIYAPDIAEESEIPDDFPLAGSFNRENAVTAIAALKTIHVPFSSLSSVVWPGRFQRVGNFIIDGAHNPPAAAALSESLREAPPQGGKIDLIAGFCGDKDAASVLRTLSAHIRRGFAVRIDNPRSMTAEATADEMRRAGINATPCASLEEALAAVDGNPALICGSLFLAGEALVALGAYPWTVRRTDPSETLTSLSCPRRQESSS